MQQIISKNIINKIHFGIGALANFFFFFAIILKIKKKFIIIAKTYS